MELPQQHDWFPLTLPPGDQPLDLSLGGESVSSFVYVDVGAWTGDGKAQPRRRDFVLVCGRTVVVCSFDGTRPFAPLGAPLPEDERGPLQKVLELVAGPQKADVNVTRILRASCDAPEGEGRVHLLLPDVHLPLVTKLPELPPDLVPDPSTATCACHGPMVTRILYGTEARTQYRAIGAMLSRNPTEWFYTMAASHKAAALDLTKLLDRIARRPLPFLHVVQLGGLFDFWPGYDCVFAGNGRMAFVRPTLDDAPVDLESIAKMGAEVVSTQNRDAVAKLFAIPPVRRTVLTSPADHGPDAKPTSFEIPGLLFAENRPEPFAGCQHEPPLGFLALREQRAQFRPWLHRTMPGLRLSILANVVPRWRERRFAVYAMAHTQMPCAVEVKAQLS